MKTKKCTVEPPPPPPPPDPCKEQKIRQKIKAGIKICPPVQPANAEPPSPPPSCHALCIEKIKNLPVKVTKQPIVCTVKREETGHARCDKIRDLKAAHPDLPWPGCEPPPPPPPLPEPNLCELQKKRAKLEECKERMKRYKL
ncbi:wiskott-Aldrich syndrome protein family member 1-like [Maniola jurtina]|uniref:wiskott-Aldrich syndrome protein family member 1-like n=1 Tax=Maniola jurtina TaxID=191418 RepID=UPI001E68BE66|nr:wiskott-Aldrich syndrome protein family member 1-like [Maniola jurtina]